MKTRKLAIQAIAIVATTMLVSCGKEAGRTTGEQATKSSVKETAQAKLRGDMPSETADMVDLAIAVWAKSSGNSTGFANVSGPRVSDSLIQRLKPYEDVQWSFSVKGVTSPLDGSRNIIGTDGQIVCKASGARTCEITFTDGEVGVVGGEIFVKDGTKVQVDQVKYSFSGGGWKK